ncbi:tyrosine-protein phosphatase [Mammaliicoccus sp. Dog046]|uniref:tyrosine-protein phosphatase n=1 Tax=Mammaliicoccus sp. Dog046 TaxID=3034233 RepID=UPI002B25A826|nr:CpsB/CapC family capsule biosynthesis tyrosine phosphatase [Mammaliicoccus sp. Dog046]WQK85154.1 CpsB/CapC family capsule biosynthesis tyrosine phosphatase [Mammaliicoccus sp. Dog046]
MIDIHNHLIVGVDDGAQTDEDFISLIEQAHDQGITGIVLTPHHLHPRYDNSFADVTKAVEELKQRQEVKDLNIDLYPGQEIRITDKILDEIDQHKLSGLNHSKYLLIELPSNEVPHYTKHLLFEIQARGFIPIIAHPERNKAIAKDINLLYELINNGSLSQLTASSLIGTHGKNLQKLSIQMLEHNLVHFIASDAHHSERRPFSMDGLFGNSKTKHYEPEIKQLLNNNENLIQDKDIATERPMEYKKKRFGLF